ncbi:MAG: 2-succinyl-5-enolpyruvyl-6-hydroxy-3-cyclohexene-1-carboxylic-acid synthase [Candidatus Zixiibacteriota bacterium]
MINREASGINELWANLIVEELHRHSIDRFVLSPGSRCTPLTAAIARRGDACAVTHFDERGAAFFALGLARATGKPAALICTSGTAAANYYPAVVEAAMDMVPMVILTADRPPELRGTGANQTIDQIDLYGKYVRFHHDLPCPDLKESPARLLEIIDTAIEKTLHSPRGPVHLNCPYREPLAPTGKPKDFTDHLSGLESWINSGSPFTAPQPSIAASSEYDLQQILSLIEDSETGLILAGKLVSDAERRSTLELSDKLGWPIFADPRSGLRLGSNHDNLIAYFDQLLLDNAFISMNTEVILHFGGVMTSKRLNQYLSDRGPRNYIHIADHPFRHDPNHVVTHRIQADINAACSGLASTLKPKTAGDLARQLRKANALVHTTIDKIVTNDSNLTEFAVARLISQNIAPDSALFLGSSMPIRDMEMYGDPHGHPVYVIANRGASGIDGGIATIAGCVTGMERPGTIIIGDLAFLHDLNSLALVKQSKQPLTIVVLNNNGGGIFSFLPVRECGDIFEKYFATPHGFSFKAAANMFDLDHHQPLTPKEFNETYVAAQRGAGSIIEIKTDREQNYQAHTKLQNEIRNALGGQ